MKQNAVILLDTRYLPVLKVLLREVVCTRCGRHGDDHANADHVLEDPENVTRVGRSRGSNGFVGGYPLNQPQTIASRRRLA